jgi:hypothetical protein
MAKAVENAVKAAVATFVVLAIASFIGPALGSFAFSIGKTFIVRSMVIAGVGAFVGTLTADAPDGLTNQNFGSKFVSTNPIAPRQIVYGECRVGGTVVYMKTRGTQNSTLDLIVAIAGHEIQSIEKVFISKQEATTSDTTVNSTTVKEVTLSDFVNSENENSFTSGRLIRFTSGLGADNQDMNAHTIATTDFTADHDLKSIAYVHFEMIYDAQKLTSIPEISFQVKGKKVFDPRNSSTAFSDNPALIVRDILTDTRFGLRATNSKRNNYR